MYSRLLIWITLLLFSYSGVHAETIELAAEDDAAPWSQKDGSGYANEVVVAAYKAVGIDAKLLVMPYARCKHMVVEGEIAGCFSMAKLPELEKTVAFPDTPLFVCYSDYFQNVNKPIVARPVGAPTTTATAASLPKGSRVGAVEGYEYPAAVYAMKDAGAIVMENCASEELNLKKLAESHLDAALINYNETKPEEFLMIKAGVTGKVEVAFHAGAIDVFIGFSRKHAQGPRALEKYNAGMKLISEDGTLKAIEKKWVEIARKDSEQLKNKSPAPADQKAAQP